MESGEIQPYRTEIMPAGEAPAPRRALKFKDDLPVRLREKYEEWANSPDYLDLQEQITLLDLRVGELVQRYQEGDSVEGRKELVEDLRRLLDHCKDHAEVERLDGEQDGPWGELVSTLKSLLRRAQDQRRHDEVAHDLEAAIDTQRKCKESEVRRLVNAHMVLTIPESYALVRSCAEIIEEYVDDPERRGRAVRRIYQLLERKR